VNPPIPGQMNPPISGQVSGQMSPTRAINGWVRAAAEPRFRKGCETRGSRAVSCGGIPDGI
jgi:hypothetical protein